MRNKRHFVLALALALPLAALAADDVTVGDLSRIQSETLLLKAKANLAATQADLYAKTHTASSANGNEEEDVPVVKAVYGVGRRDYATFLFSNGSSIDASAGDILPGGLKVLMVTVDRVVLTKGKKKIGVSFSSTAPTDFSQSTKPQGATGNGMPLSQMPLPGAIHS